MAIVYLVAGHEVRNGKGTGVHGFIDEAVEAEKMRNVIDALLPTWQVKVVKDDNSLTLRNVVNWLLRLRPTEKDIVVDIHFNAASASATGTEVWIPKKPTQRERDFAAALAAKMSEVLMIRNRGVKTSDVNRHGRLAMLDDVTHPTNVLLEVCFATNSTDVNSYNANFQTLCRELAWVIAQEVRNNK